MSAHWPAPASAASNTSGCLSREQVSFWPRPVTTCSAQTLSTRAPTFCIVPPTPPTLSVPPTDRWMKSVSIGGVRPTAAAASVSSAQLTPASTSATCRPVSMPWIVARPRLSTAMPPGTSACPKFE